MKTQHHHPKLKTHPRPLFSCGFFCQCTHSETSSPTNPTSPSLPLSTSSTTPTTTHQPITTTTTPPPPPPPPHPKPTSLPPPPRKPESSSSSSSSSTSQSFTQWKFPLINSPLHHYHSKPEPTFPSGSPPISLPVQSVDVKELFHVAELRLSTGSEPEQMAALQLLERSLVPNPPADPVCPPELMRLVVATLKRGAAAAKPATKILLALCLAEGNRRVAVEAAAVGTVVEVVMELESAVAERALAALELACTVAEGAAELRAHALAVPVMVAMMGKMTGRGREYAISALAVIYGNGVVPGEQMHHPPPEEVARAVVLALQGDITARGRRKGTQLLKSLEDYERPDLNQEENETVVI